MGESVEEAQRWRSAHAALLDAVRRAREAGVSSVSAAQVVAQTYGHTGDLSPAERQRIVERGNDKLSGGTFPPEAGRLS